MDDPLVPPPSALLIPRSAAAPDLPVEQVVRRCGAGVVAAQTARGARSSASTWPRRQFRGPLCSHRRRRHRLARSSGPRRRPAPRPDWSAASSRRIRPSRPWRLASTAPCSRRPAHGRPSGAPSRRPRPGHLVQGFHLQRWCWDERVYERRVWVEGWRASGEIDARSAPSAIRMYA